MRDFLLNRLFTSEGLFYALVVVATVLGVGAVTRTDKHGFEVTGGDPFYYCTEIIPAAADHQLAKCMLLDECNRICDKQRNITK